MFQAEHRNKIRNVSESLNVFHIHNELEQSESNLSLISWSTAAENYNDVLSKSEDNLEQSDQFMMLRTIIFF